MEVDTVDGAHGALVHAVVDAEVADLRMRSFAVGPLRALAAPGPGDDRGAALERVGAHDAAFERRHRTGCVDRRRACDEGRA